MGPRSLAGKVMSKLRLLWLVGIAVFALGTAFLELGMALLAILGLFMPDRCSMALERAITWLSTSVRHLAKKIAPKS